MRVLHADFAINVQEGWEDASRIAFAEPADGSAARELESRSADAGARIDSKAAVAMPRANFILSHRPYRLAMPAHRFIEAELKAMLSAVPNAQVGQVGWTKMGSQEAAFVEVALHAEGMPVKQLHALSVVGDQLYHFVGTSSPGRFKVAREFFLETLSSFEQRSLS